MTRNRFQDANYQLLEELVAQKESRVRTATLQSVNCVLSQLRKFLMQQHPDKDYRTVILTPELCTRFVEFLNSSLKQSSVRNYIHCLSALLNEAEDDGIISSNPLRRVSRTNLPPKEDNERVFLTKSELQTLRDAHCPHASTRNAFLLSCYTGLSFVDISSLTWDDFVVNDGVMMIEKVLKQNGKKAKVPVVSITKLLLSDIRKEYDSAPAEQQDGFLFHLYSKPIVIKDLNRWQENAGLDKKLAFSVGRFTFGTLAVSAGVDLCTLAQWMGLSDIHTAKIYVDLVNRNRASADVTALDFILS